jgi:hypothetical protein
LDAGKSGIFAWIGKQCSKDEKLQAMKHAEKFLVEKGYPQWTKVILPDNKGLVEHKAVRAINITIALYLKRFNALWTVVNQQPLSSTSAFGERPKTLLQLTEKFTLSTVSMV